MKEARSLLVIGLRHQTWKRLQRKVGKWKDAIRAQQGQQGQPHEMPTPARHH